MTFHLLRVSPLSLYVQSPSLTLLRFHKTPPFLPSQHLGNSLLCGQDSDRITRSSNSVSAIMQQTVTGGGAPRTMQGPQRPSACSPGPVLSPPGPRSPPPAPLLLGLHLLCPHPHLSSLEHSPVLRSKSPRAPAVLPAHPQRRCLGTLRTCPCLCPEQMSWTPSIPPTR